MPPQENKDVSGSTSNVDAAQTLQEDIALWGENVALLAEKLEESDERADKRHAESTQFSESLAWVANWIFKLTIPVLIVLMLSFVTTAFTYYSNKETRKAAEDARNTAAAIRDCTTPEGECYQRSRFETAKALEIIALQGQIASKLTEFERLKTEVPVADQKNDEIGFNVRDKRNRELIAEIAAVNEQIAIVQKRPFPGNR